jgi:hypothetical protein
MQFVRRLEPFQNVAATGHFVLTSKLVLGNVVERIILELGGTSLTKAMITNLVVRLNGKVIFGPISATYLDLIQRYLLLVNDPARLTIDFTEPVSRSIQGQLMGAIHTNAAGVTDFTIEGDITGATAPTLVAYAMLRSPLSMTPERGFDPATLPLIRAIIPTTVTETAAGEFQHDLNYGSRGDSLIKRIFINSTILTAFKVRQDSLDIYEGVSSALAGFIESEYGRDDQANLYVWDPLVDGNQSDAVVTRSGQRESVFQFLFTASGSGVHTVFTDVYTTLGRL